VAPSGPQVVLIHGEDEERTALKVAIKERYGLDALCPAIDDVIELN
jgi:predicted metal-dependent RNase